jgi:hypothetical protein
LFPDLDVRRTDAWALFKFQRADMLKRPFCILVAVALLLSWVHTERTAASETLDQSSGWSPPSLVLIPEYTVGDDRFTVVADASGRLHAFFSVASLQENGDPAPEYPYNTILYTYSDDGASWSEPVDVIIPDAPKAWQGAGIDAATDSRGNIHLFFRGNPTNGGVLKYVRSHASVAANPHSWQGPVTGEWGMIVTKVAIVVGRDDRLHVTYSARPGDVYYHSSADYGHTWSADSRIAEINPRFSAPDDVALAIDNRGRIHAAWSENKLPEGYPPIGVFYAYSDDDGHSWGPARQLGGQYATRVAMAVRDPDEVHLVWSTSNQDRGRYAAVSYDGGVTWSQPELVIRNETGLSTYPEQTLVDSAGTIYWVLTAEEGDYLTKLPPGGAWSPPVQLTFPPIAGWTKTHLTSGTAAAMVGENELHLITREGPRPEQGENDRYWHTKLLLDAPVLPLSPIPTVAPTTAPTTAVVGTPAATSSPRPTLDRQTFAITRQDTGPTPSLVTVIAVSPAALLVVLVAGYQFTKRRRSR